jgi:hypothetical protein
MDEVDGAQPLIHAALWERVAPGDDPIGDPALDVDEHCGPEATTVELNNHGSYYDIDTTSCDWLTVTQPALGALSPGDTLRVWAFRWANMVAEGTGRMTVAAGDPPVTLWEIYPRLPAPEAELYYDHVTVSHQVPTGTPLYWHVSNHGDNVWSLIGLLRVDD